MTFVDSGLNGSEVSRVRVRLLSDLCWARRYGLHVGDFLHMSLSRAQASLTSRREIGRLRTDACGPSHTSNTVASLLTRDTPHPESGFRLCDLLLRAL